MAGWMFPLLLCGLHIAAPARAFSVVYNSGQQGRKLFGGYRIVPRSCKPSTISASDSSASGVCMFNYECSQRNGEVVGACMDGFLFGACCRLPPGAAFPVNEVDELDQESLITVPSQENNQPFSSTWPSTKLPSIPHPEADTILVHQNGSAVVDMDRPEDLFRPSTVILPGNSIQDTDIIYGGTTATTGRPPFSTINYITHYSSSLPKEETTEGKHTTFSYVLNYDSSKPLGSQTTRPYTERITMSRPLVSTYYGTTKPSSTLPFRPRPSYLTTTQRPSTLPVQSDTDNLVLVSTTTSDRRPEVTNADPDITTDSINPESINHILLLLNDSNSEFADPEPEPNPHFPPPSSLPEPIPHFPPPTNAGVFNPQAEPVPHFPPSSNAGQSNPQPEPVPHFPPQAEPIPHFPPQAEPIPHFPPQAEPIPHFPPPSDSETGGFSTWVSVDGQMTSSSYRPPSTWHQTSSSSGTKSPSLGEQVSEENKVTPESGPTYEEVPLTTRPQSKPPAPTVIVLSPLSSDYTTAKTPASQSAPSWKPTTSTSQRPQTTVYADSNWTQHPIITSKPVSQDNTVSSKPVANLGSVVTKLPSITFSSVLTSRPPSTQSFIKPTTLPSVSDDRPVIVTLRPSSSQTVGNSNGPTSLQETTLITKRPSATTQSSTRPTNRPVLITARPSPTRLTTPSPITSTAPLTTSVSAGTLTTVSKFPSSTNYPVDYGASTSVADLANFPPVRNPQLNMSFVQNQHEQPGIVYVTELPAIQTDSIMVDEEELLEHEITTPSFIEDEKLNNKIQIFVNKIVSSLQENFDDLENVLYRRKNQTSTTTRRPVSTLTTQKRPTTTRRPVRPTGTPLLVSSTTRRPTPSRRPTVRPLSTPTARPTQRPLSTPRPTGRPTGRPTQRPLSTLSPRPQTTRPRPSTAAVLVASTSRPTRPPGSTTKRPRPSTTTKRPKPTKRSTTTSSTTNLIQAVEEATEQISLKPALSNITTTSTTTITTTTPAPTTTTTTVTTLSSTPSSSTAEESTLQADEETTTHKPVDFRNECGVRPLMKKGGRIVGGKGATFGAWPWQVLVRESTWLGLFTKNKCGGVLITNRFVTTAAHCQPGFLANLVAVLGEFDLSGELESKRSVTKNVKRVIVHRNYDAATFANDLALLELDSPVTFDEHIVPICMPSDNEDFTGRMATVSGWGRLKYGGGVPSVLQEVQVPVIENSVCQEMFLTAGHQKVILNSFLCAGYASGQKDSCEGDSGGPLMYERPDGRWVLVGTVSHGIKCAAPYLPGVYMRTTYYKPWLKSITGVK